MTEEDKDRVVEGICSTCNHAKVCMYLKRAKEPIWMCDEYDDKVEIKEKKLKEKKEDIVEKYDGVIPKGLCCNCEHLRTCKLPRPETGVWCCEEYQIAEDEDE